MARIKADRLIEIIEAVGYETAPYSGRGMGGAQCISIKPDTDSVRQVISGLMRECDEADEAADLYVGHLQDELGRGIVVYWPKCPWSETI